MFGTKKLAGNLVNRAGRSAYDASISASKAKGIGVGSADRIAQDAMNSAMVARSKTAQSSARKIIYGGGAVVSASVSSAMRPGPSKQQTGYRRPMTSSPPGSGRFA